MLSDKMQKAINEQINYELYSAYIYYGMAAYFAEKDLNGMSNWFKVQTQEELFHASKFVNYMQDRDGRVRFSALNPPESDWKSPLAAFEDALKHEREVTRRINNLVTLANEEKDQPTHNFLQWFVSEQVEEEATAKAIIGQLRIIGDNGSGLFLVDRELGTRTFVMPTTKGGE